jgi:hypothetical protein
VGGLATAESSAFVPYSLATLYGPLPSTLLSSPEGQEAILRLHLAQLYEVITAYSLPRYNYGIYDWVSPSQGVLRFLDGLVTAATYSANEAEDGIRTHGLLHGKQPLWPTELLPREKAPEGFEPPTLAFEGLRSVH